MPRRTAVSPMSWAAISIRCRGLCAVVYPSMSLVCAGGTIIVPPGMRAGQVLVLVDISRSLPVAA